MAKRRVSVGGAPAKASRPIASKVDPKALSVMVAAAERAAHEIREAHKEWAVDGVGRKAFHIKAPFYLANVMTKANWRKINLHKGHELTWDGAVRHGAKGKLLFSFEPEMNSELESRDATAVEIPHDELDGALGNEFSIWLCEGLGVSSLDALIEQARVLVDPEDLAKASSEIAEEQKQEVQDKLASNPNWGAWA